MTQTQKASLISAAGNAFALPQLEPQPAEGTQLMHSKRTELDLLGKDPDLFNPEPRVKIGQGNRKGALMEK